MPFPFVLIIQFFADCSGVCCGPVCKRVNASNGTGGIFGNVQLVLRGGSRNLVSFILCHYGSAAFASGGESLPAVLFWKLQIINKSSLQKTGVIYLLLFCNSFEPRWKGDICLYAFIVTLCPV